MQTILTLALLIVAGLVLFVILASIRAMARTIWLKIGPFLVALAAAFATLAVFLSAVSAHLNQDAAPWATASVVIAALVAIYMLSRKWFAKNWTDKIGPPAVSMKPAVKLVEAPFASHTEFAPLEARRRLWRRIEPSDDARFRHLLGYLRMTLIEERSSLEFSERAITQMWSRSPSGPDLEFIEVQGKILTWLRNSEKQLVEAKTMSRPQQMFLCEKVVHILEGVAVESRGLLAKRGDSDLEAMKQRMDHIAKL